MTRDPRRAPATGQARLTSSLSLGLLSVVYGLFRVLGIKPGLGTRDNPESKVYAKCLGWMLILSPGLQFFQAVGKCRPGKT